ncbi:MAG TPA: site-specific integrase [Chitinophagales bacterium]|nr:site-specific integrase [Chitinophagales bacterium]
MKLYKNVLIADRGGDLNQIWYIHYHFQIPGTLRYKRFRVTGNINRLKTKRERQEGARLVRAEMEQMLREGYNPFSDKAVTIVNSDMSFGDAIKYYDENHIAHTGDRSKQNYKWTMRKMKDVIGINTPLSSIKSSMIREALNKLQNDNKHANRTRNNILQSMSALFTFLCNDEEIALKENPCKFIKDLPVGASTQNTPATDEEFERIVSHLYKTNKRLLLAFSFVLYLSVRTTELGKIQRKQIVQYKDNLAITLHGANVKNKKSRLQLIPPDLARLMLELEIAKLPPDHFLLSYGMKPNAVAMPSFRNRAGEIWKEEVKDVLHVDVNLYSAKHYQASALASKGMDERDIQKWADHQDVKVTRNYIRGNVPLVPIKMMNDLVKLPVYKSFETLDEPIFEENKKLIVILKENGYSDEQIKIILESKREKHNDQFVKA